MGVSLGVPSSLRLVEDGMDIASNAIICSGGIGPNEIALTAEEEPKLTRNDTLALTLDAFGGGCAINSYSVAQVLGPMPFGGVKTDPAGLTFQFEADRAFPDVTLGHRSVSGRLPLNRDRAGAAVRRFSDDIIEQAPRCVVWNEIGGLLSVSQSTIGQDGGPDDFSNYEGVNFGRSGFILRVVFEGRN